jgi:hypothetical protein
MVSLRYLELLLVDWIICFEVDSVMVVFGKPKAILVNSDGILVLKKDINVCVLEFWGHL